MSEIIRAEQVGYVYQSKYQRTQALTEVTCSFEQGLVYAITGKSGSGKSTFLSLLAGLDVPTEGSIYVEGQDIRTMDRDRYRREQAAVIYQAFHLFPLLTVLENVMFPMNLRKVPKKEARRRAVELLDKVGLPDALHQKMPGMISGGEQQRVAIARAMASGARIILADEPTGNLDSQNEKNVIDLLEGMAHEEGYTVIIVTHSEKIAGTADVVYGMLDGRLEVVRP
ncbi:MAG TPA: ABC transporter ATP-binding protein [Candidatus Merdiplasma excrementigallinarum]|uniref:ABC transporter ATP-binding protein n=1 Tax=Candidatus Merdiplasma excrementigallinarum TaxID=2840864 RepID=A0A9D1NX83_9FIRM|nr:ABC transporter ATP-binding protein [Candidatus Merdiplasma excrementigallinarum]